MSMLFHRRGFCGSARPFVTIYIHTEDKVKSVILTSPASYFILLLSLAVLSYQICQAIFFLKLIHGAGKQASQKRLCFKGAGSRDLRKKKTFKNVLGSWGEMPFFFRSLRELRNPDRALSCLV